MKKFYLFTGIFLASVALMAQTNIGGTFTNNTTLTVANSPYIVTSNITVNAGVILTIESGVELRFNSGTYIVVYGTMQATGATFTANSSTSKGFWSGLYVGYEWGADYGQITLDNCQVEYAVSIYVRKGTLTTTNNTLIQNFSSHGFDIYNDGTVVTDLTTISGCNYPIYFRGNGILNAGNGMALTGNANDYIFINFTDINNNFICRNLGIPYYYDSELRINPGGLLQLEPGVHFLGNTGAWISVNGKMKALGTATDSVVFDREPSNSYWAGINFNDAATDTACIFTYTRFSGATYNYYNSRNYNISWCAVEIIKSSPSFTNCEFSGNHYNLVVTGQASPVFSKCDFQPSINPVEQTLNINMDMNASPVFDSCAINFNASEGRAIGLIGSIVYDNSHLKQISFNNLSNITYTLEGQVTIHDTASLTIDPGIVIKCRDRNNYLYANGPLTGIGTATSPIIFTFINDDNYGNPKDTHNNGTGTIANSSSGRIMLYSSNGVSRLKYWKIIYGGLDTYNYSVYINNNNILENCEILNSYRGILFYDNAQILNNHIANINYYPLARRINAGNPVLIGNTVTNIGNLGIYIYDFFAGNYSFGGLDFAGNTNVAYIIDNTLTIPSTADITILPGTVIKLTEYYGNLVVQGGLKADGLAANRIIFTSIFDNSVSGNTNFNGGADPVGHKWGGIQFAGASHDTTNMLNWCEIRYSRSGITITDCKVVMNETLLNFADYYGVSIFGSANPVITNCSFNNLAIAPVYMDLFANPVFSGNSMANVGQAGIRLRGGTVSGTVPVRSFAGYDTITYLLEENLRVDGQLTIPAGLVFKSSNNSYFDVYGKLTVAGTSGKPVVFTSLYDDDYGKPKDTQQNGKTYVNQNGSRIIFRDQSDDSSRVEYAVMRYSINYSINLVSASPLISHVNFHNNRDCGIYMSGTSAPVVQSCVFDNTPFPMTLSLLSFPSAESNNILTGTTGKGLQVINGETLTQNHTLRKRNFAGIINIPYIFNNYTIGTSAVLTIEPGVIMKFKQSGFINVRNGLIADGGSTPDSTIVFTADEDDFYGGDTYGNGNVNPGRNWWQGIHFAAESIDGSCIMDNCIIKNASNVYSYNAYIYNRGAVTIDNASPTLTNCLFESNFWAILARNTSVPVITNNNFSDTDPNYGYGVWNETGTVTVTAKNCWWGDDTGPYHATLNPGGQGERVSDNVDFTPWISAPTKPVMGDVSLNGEVMPYDASLILQHTVGNITLNQSQLDVADVSHDGTVSSYDASLVLQYTVGLITGFGQTVKKSLAAGDPVVAELPAGPFMTETSVFEIPVWFTTSENIKAVEILFTTDPDHIRFLGINTDDLPGYIMTASGYDENTGEIRISFASAYDLALARNKLVLTFELRNKEVSESILALKNLKGNEKYMSDTGLTLTINSSNTSTGIGEAALRKLKLYNRDNYLIADLVLNTGQSELVIDVYDLSGRKTNGLIFHNLSAGTHRLTFSAEENDSHYPLKVYVVMVRGDHFSITRKIVLR